MGMRLAAALGACLALAAGAASADDRVTLSQGALQGVTLGVVTSFKDIPYAAPPIGPLRWRPPAAPEAWSGVRKADAYGPQCIQPARPGSTTPMSEDCLSLNIWTPAGRTPSSKMPVMVWIHGGVFVFGSGATPFYDGGHFAERGVVLVTINYRLGRIGFFAHPALTRAEPGGLLGNYGLMDQIAALQWVKANIAAFGGDPANVTVFGESAGAISVNYLLTSPMGGGLFSKAIAESRFGRVEAAPVRGGARSAEAIGTGVARGLGVKGDDAAALAALRALPAEKLNAPISGLSDPTIPAPMIDGRLVTETIAAAFAAGREIKIPMLEGGNSWEASLIPAIAKDPEATLKRAGPDRAKVMALWGASGDLVKTAMDLTTDSMITEPDRFLARQMTRAGEPVFVYRFSHVPAVLRGKTPGAPHGGEVAYVFDNLPDHDLTLGFMEIPAATPEDRKLADAMIAYWVAFASSGEPGSAGGVPWPAVSAGDDVVMEFGDDGPVVRHDFEKARLDLLAAKAHTAPTAPVDSK
ncbi:MAG TPA: carboxylesterase family protein [Caulobacteraceae bacterium]